MGWRFLLLCSVVALGACGGSTDVVTADSGPPADAAADAPVLDAGDAQGDAPSDATDAGPMCAADGGFIGDFKTCHGADECQAVKHTLDCCGSMKWVGVAKSEAASYAACETAWVDTLPSCGCDPADTVAEDGKSVVDPSSVTVECTNWTMSSGVCMTRVKDADAGASAGVACGSAVCTPGTEMCCVAGSAPSMQCELVNAVGPKCDFSAVCDGPEDCGAGQSCCGPSGAKIATYCASGACPAGDTLCHTPSDCPGSGQLCCPSSAFGWPHSVCATGSACP